MLTDTIPAIATLPTTRKTSRVYWCALPERHGCANDVVFNSLLNVAMHAGKRDFRRLSIDYSRTDHARNSLCSAFLQASDDPNDLLVMLDTDHRYPADILEAFAEFNPEMGVVGALAYRRGAPYEPLFFFDIEGQWKTPAKINLGPVYQCACVSTSAISIRRWVLEKLIAAGHNGLFFRYEYLPDGQTPSEDIYFGRICQANGIHHYVDTGLVIPHLAWGWIDAQAHEAYDIAYPQPTIRINGDDSLND